VELAQCPLNAIEVPAQRPGQIVTREPERVLAEAGPDDRGIGSLYGLGRSSTAAEQVPRSDVEYLRDPNLHTKRKALEVVDVRDLVGADAHAARQLPQRHPALSDRVTE